MVERHGAPPPIRLDVGLPAAMWGLWLGCLVPVVALLSVVMAAVGWMLLSSEEKALAVLVLLPFLLLDGFIGLLLVQHYRTAYWLDGRVLVRRGIRGRRRYDLTAAHVSADTAQPVWTNWRGGVLPRLVVQVGGHAPARMWLRDPARGGALLPPAQLAALAQAIDPGLRHPVARRLWELAADPLRGAL
ncbi:hypothetical protein SAMN05443665_1005259 [Actinomadura meyerae]|uniref:Uncharacterized protein n=1 Tax=Actinomadura meyerae TaxID=240840 RepID=A0A239FD90_9ACTN|nr:hypothetical protein [Actinomadura meyerae]SNS54112.1 hypothetical protein SAMN05443665_1005259 [Actinomadura meyerae]